MRLQHNFLGFSRCLGAIPAPSVMWKRGGVARAMACAERNCGGGQLLALGTDEFGLFPQLSHEASASEMKDQSSPLPAEGEEEGDTGSGWLSLV